MRPKRGLGKVAGPTRLELATSGVTGQRSNQTELRPRSTAERLGNYNHSRAKMQESLFTRHLDIGAVRYMLSRAAIRSSIGGCVLKSLFANPFVFRSGLTM